MVSPASTLPFASVSAGVLACLSRVSAASVLVGVMVLSIATSVLLPSGLVALATAVLATTPASTSAWVIA